MDRALKELGASAFGWLVFGGNNPVPTRTFHLLNLITKSLRSIRSWIGMGVKLINIYLRTNYPTILLRELDMNHWVIGIVPRRFRKSSPRKIPVMVDMVVSADSTLIFLKAWTLLFKTMIIPEDKTRMQELVKRTNHLWKFLECDEKKTRLPSLRRKCPLLLLG